jgi:flagellar FliL protein
MADEQPQTVEGAPRRPGMLLVIAGLVGGMILGGVGGAFALGPMVAKRLVASAPSAGNDAEEDESDATHGAEGEEQSGSVVHMMENLVLNPAGSNGTRFLMAGVAVEVKDDNVKQAMTTRDAEMRDAVLRLLGERSVEQLTDMSLREGMKRQLADSLNGRLAKKDAVKRVYFPQFVIQ